MIINNFSYELLMLYYEGIDVSEGIDVNKVSESKEFLTRLFYFKKHAFQGRLKVSEYSCYMSLECFLTNQV